MIRGPAVAVEGATQALLACSLLACSLWACRPAPVAAAPQALTAAPQAVDIAAAPSAASAPVAPEPPPPFALGCDIDLPDPLPERVILVRDDDGERWIWACRAVARLGEPTVRDSGYPDFHVLDRATGACLALSLEDIGAFIYYAPEGRGEALRDYLAAAPPPVPDCHFEVGLDGDALGPRRVGIRRGEPYSEPLYPAGFDGARAFFEAHPSEQSAYRLVAAYLELPPPRPIDATPLIERAVVIELDVFDKMERAWLSDIGAEGYCARSKELARLPLSRETKARLAGEEQRFCR